MKTTTLIATSLLLIWQITAQAQDTLPSSTPGVLEAAAISPPTSPANVIPVNNCPTADNLNVTVDPGSSVNLQLPASDPDGDPLEYTVTRPPDHGIVVLQPTGTASYSPNVNYCGSDSFSFAVSDGLCQPVPATVFIIVPCLNQCPTAVPRFPSALALECVGLSNVVIAPNNNSACIILDGSASSDPDGDALTYVWSVDGRFTVNLDPGQEAGVGGTGSGSGTVTLQDSSLAIDIGFSGLSANATATHIHGPAAPGVNAGVLYPLNALATLGVTAGTINGSVTLVNGTGGFSIEEQLQQLRLGLWYVNIHSSAHPAGEIRGQIVPSGQGAVMTTCLPIGSHDVCLTVVDGQCSDTACVRVEVISPCQAVAALMLQVESWGLSSQQIRPLNASLLAACASFERGSLRSGANQLRAFQQKVRAQIAPSEPALAEQLIQCTQQIIDAVSEP